MNKVYVVIENNCIWGEWESGPVKAFGNIEDAHKWIEKKETKDGQFFDVCELNVE